MEDLNKELEQAARLRQLHGQVQPPTTPDADYFAQMEASVFEKLKAEGALRVPNHATQMTALKGGRWRVWAVAASALVVFALAGRWYMQQNTQVEQIAAATEITTEDADAWILDHIEAFEPQEIVVVDVLNDTEAQQPAQEPNSSHAEPLVTPDDSDLLEGMTDEDLEDLL